MAHLKMAVRFANLATDPVAWHESLHAGDSAHFGAGSAQAVSRDDVSKALVDAFELPASGAFANLLEAIDESARTRQVTSVQDPQTVE